MKVLGIDTSTAAGSAAVAVDGTILGEFYIESSMTHSVKFMPMMSELLRTLGMDIREMDGVAVTVGPGSFTGLRIGLAHAKAICHALNIPIAGVNTLDALAYNAASMGDVVCPMLDARNEQVYAAVYEKGRRTSDYMGIGIYELMNELKGRRAVILGDGARKYGDILAEDLPDAATAPSNLMMPRASSAALIGGKRLAEGDADDLYGIVPFYMRKPQAERLRDNSKGS